MACTSSQYFDCTCFISVVMLRCIIFQWSVNFTNHSNIKIFSITSQLNFFKVSDSFCIVNYIKIAFTIYLPHLKWVMQYLCSNFEGIELVKTINWRIMIILNKTHWSYDVIDVLNSFIFWFLCQLICTVASPYYGAL